MIELLLLLNWALIGLFGYLIWCYEADEQVEPDKIFLSALFGYIIFFLSLMFISIINKEKK